MKVDLHFHRCLSLPIYLTVSAACTAFLTVPSWAAHSDPSKTNKTAAAPAAPAAAPAKQAAPELTPVTLLGMVRSAKIFDTEYPIHVTLGEKEATLTTLRHPKATDQDCKIDAVLAAKTVMDVYPKEISRIKLVLSTSNSDLMQEVIVTTGDVKAYATGTISKDDLLSSLELKKAEPSTAEKDAAADTQTEDAKPVANGAYKINRQLLAGRIERLKARGTGTQPFEEMLAKIEADIQKPASEVPRPEILKEIRTLNSHLYEQEEAFRSAQHVAKGTGVQGGGDHDGTRGGGTGHGLGHFEAGKLFREKIKDMQNNGQNIADYKKQWDQIQTMKDQNDFAGAIRATKSLFQQMGIDFPAGGANGRGSGNGPGGGGWRGQGGGWRGQGGGAMGGGPGGPMGGGPGGPMGGGSGGQWGGGRSGGQGGGSGGQQGGRSLAFQGSGGQALN